MMVSAERAAELQDMALRGDDIDISDLSREERYIYTKNQNIIGACMEGLKELMAASEQEERRSV